MIRTFLSIILTIAFISLSFSADDGKEDGEFDKIITSLAIFDNSDPTASFKIITDGFNSFKKLIATSTYFTAHKSLFTVENEGGYVSPICEFLAFLTSHSGDEKIAPLLDYLLKTGGPFGISPRPATPSERFICELAAKSVVRTDHTLCQIKYNTNHAHELQRIQQNFLDKVENPLEAPEKAAAGQILDQHPYFKDKLVLSTSNDRWKALIEFVQKPDFFHHEDHKIWQDQPQKYLFLNDLMLLGFTLDLSPRLTKHASLHPQTYLYEEWQTTNNQMEDAHNYVQWWFPNASTSRFGDGQKSLRLTQHTLNRINQNGEFLKRLKPNLQLSFLRMISFWGQKFTDKSLERVDAAWEKNWVEENPHNHLRISRLLLWLKAFQMDEEYHAMQAYLQKVNEKYTIDNRTFTNYWSKHPVKDLMLPK